MEHASNSPAPSRSRLTELDWVRIIAFGLLILYHTGMFYTPEKWHVKSPTPVAGLRDWMDLLSPWRLSLLFAISGAATTLLLTAGSAQRFAWVRSKRLVLPLLFGMAVIVPPQSYFQVIEQMAYQGSFWSFMGDYYLVGKSFCQGDSCLGLPAWNHLWFVLYLWAYTMVIAAVVKGGGLGWLQSPRWQFLTRGARMIWIPWLILAAFRLMLFKQFPSTHDFFNDYHNHALYGTVFLFGLLLFGQRDDRHGAWAAAVRLRWVALGVAVLVYAAMTAVWSQYSVANPLPDNLRLVLRSFWPIVQWCPIVAILGFARLHLAGRDGPMRRVLTEAVFPFYIVHQTVIVVAAHRIVEWQLPQAVEGILLIAMTAFFCGLTYLVVRRLRWLRPLFGLQMDGSVLSAHSTNSSRSRASAGV